jgi:glutamate racemase
MDNRPIGFFDSGLGGLTCISPLMKNLPEERIIYFGDTARTPYGSKAVSTIMTFSTQIADFLVHHDVKMIVIACNTVSATSLKHLRNRYPNMPILGIIQPAAKAVADKCSVLDRIGVIGTKVTIASHTYKDLIGSLNSHLNIFETPCPAFVPLIEEGIIENDIMDLTIHHYMDDFILENRINTMVLGCTHYPLIRANLERIYPDLTIINPSEEIVDSIYDILKDKDMLAMNSSVENIFYASDLSENFVRMIDRIFKNSDTKVEFKSFDIEEV